VLVHARSGVVAHHEPLQRVRLRAATRRPGARVLRRRRQQAGRHRPRPRGRLDPPRRHRRGPELQPPLAGEHPARGRPGADRRLDHGFGSRVGRPRAVPGSGGSDVRSDEIEFVRRVAPLLAEGARRALLLGEARDPEGPEAPGLLVLSSRWEVESATPGVERWVSDLPEGDWDAGRLPSAVLAVAGRALRSAEGRDEPGEVALARVITRSGKVNRPGRSPSDSPCQPTPSSSTSRASSRRRACTVAATSSERSSSRTTSHGCATTSRACRRASPSAGVPCPGLDAGRARRGRRVPRLVRRLARPRVRAPGALGPGRRPPHAG